MLKFAHRKFFESPLFNDVTQEYLDTVLPCLAKKYMLKSAKGGTGRGFKGKLAESVVQKTDMPYHIHILNGLIPTLKLLESKFKQKGWLDESQESESLLRCFVVGFTLHDINKLTDTDELKDAVETHTERLCEELCVGDFFPEWKDWIGGIHFLALSAERRTQIYALQVPISEDLFDVFNTVFAEYCHLADSFDSRKEFTSVAEFYDNLCNMRINNKKLSEYWGLSYIEVQENIFTLLTQKLLYEAKSFIRDERNQTVLFSLRNGFVYIGEPLADEDVKEIKRRFRESDLFDVISLTQIGIPDARSCNFESLALAPLSREDLKKVIEVGLSGNNQKIKLLMLGNGEDDEAIQIIKTLVDKYDLPLEVRRRGKTDNFGLYLRKEWDDLEDYQPLLNLIGLEKIKLLNSSMFPDRNNSALPQEFYNAKFEYSYKNKENLNIETINELKSKFVKPATPLTILTLVLAGEASLREEEFESYVEKTFGEVITAFVANKNTSDTQELDKFFDLYFAGNFERSIEETLNLIGNVPNKTQMCMFTGAVSGYEYNDAKTFGVAALGFSNRSINTLKNDTNNISQLFFRETALRKKDLTHDFYTAQLDKQPDAVIYYDFGEYFVDVLKQEILKLLSKVFPFNLKEKIEGATLRFDDLAYDYNPYGMNFQEIGYTIEGNFDFIYRMLILIKSTGFRIFTTSIITPYHAHKEMFVFENCMPIMKELGWDRIRLDEIDERIQEMELLKSLGKKGKEEKLIPSHLLNYARDQRYLFTAFAQVDSEDREKVRGMLVSFIDSLEEKERQKLMSVMNDLAQIAIEMVRPKSNTGSQESWIIRESLKVLDARQKEERDKETIIEHVAGDLKNTLRNRSHRDLSKCRPFATKLYEDLFEKEWGKQFPKPGSLRNWVNQFAFVYSEKADEYFRLHRSSGANNPSTSNDEENNK